MLGTIWTCVGYVEVRIAVRPCGEHLKRPEASGRFAFPQVGDCACRISSATPRDPEPSAKVAGPCG